MSTLHYVPLPTSSSVAPDEEVYPVKRTSFSRQLESWAHAAVLCTTAISFGLLLTCLARWSLQPEAQLPARTPTTYVNLDRARLNLTHQFEPIFSFASVVMQIDAADETRTMREDDRLYRSQRGIIYPDSRHVVVSSKISTIIQFRHMDYAMEICVLHAVVPDPSKPMHHNAATQLRQPSTIDVWQLDSESEISRYIPGSWERAPRRKKLLTSFTFHRTGDKVQSEEFWCRFGAYSTFELACDDCAVDFWQVQGEPHIGFFLSQSDSLAG